MRAPVAMINFASNPCENLRVYIGFNKELPHKKREINYCNWCAHPPQLLRFPPLTKTPLWKPPTNFSRNCSRKISREIPRPEKKFFAHNFAQLDERQITHLICAHLEYDLYDFFRGCFGPASFLFLVQKAQKHPPEKVI